MSPTGRAVALALALAGQLAACAASSPPSPRREVLIEEGDRPARPVLTGEHAEREAGAAEAERVAAEMGLVDAPELVAYVNELGRRLARHARMRRFEYQFRVVDQDAPNAFALPGGFIYVSRGLLALASSEDELANVLAHEIVHVTERHAAARQLVVQRSVNPLMLPGIVLGAVLGAEVGAAASDPFRMFNAPYVARYSRDQERTADRSGQELAARAGFDPHGMATFLRKLEESERFRIGHSRLPSFLDTHPTPVERVGNALAQAGLIEWTRELRDGREDPYLGRVEGLTVGPRAAEGVFRDERFLHADLDFSIRFPTGWRLVNSDLAVGAISPDRNVQIFLAVPTPGDDPAAEARRFLSEHRRRLEIRVQRARELRIGPLPAFRVEGTARSPEGRPIGGQLTWIAHRGRVYRLTAIAPAGSAREYLGRAHNTARTFRSLTPEERASITELRLRVVEARDGESLSELSERAGNAWSLQRTALANDHRVGDPLAAGQRVKIARPEPYVPAGG